jgi:hypothetical protein
MMALCTSGVECNPMGSAGESSENEGRLLKRRNGERG